MIRTLYSAGFFAVQLVFLPILVVISYCSIVSARPADLPEGWFKACTTKQDIDVCNVQNIITAGDTGQLVTGISLLEVKGKMSRKFLQVTVPSARVITHGVGLQVDTSKPQKLDYVLCFPDRCIAEMPLTDSIISSFKKGNLLILTSVNFQNQKNPVQISLQGFAAAFDGLPLRQAEIDDRQKKIQEFVSKNNEDFLRKLKEEQDKVKLQN